MSGVGLSWTWLRCENDIAGPGWIVSSQKDRMKPQPLGTRECDLRWKSGLGRYNQIKMRPYWIGSALIQYDWMAGVLVGRGSGHRLTQREEGPMKMEAEIDLHAFTSLGTPGATRNWKKQGRVLPSRHRTEHGPAESLTSNFQLPEQWGNKFLLF